MVANTCGVVKQSSGLFKEMPENGAAPQDKDSQPLRQTVITVKIEGWNIFS
ncbi:hypothetical protein STRCR_1058 [Streptococcus criceti HS-6]|uniref:Uncharacterized protein n=1 Tax=Streptococcus criceti HS-6 TaxID=873449 RepID=G5JT90_STRCG|nr:hypothetical protein STRCR_1058 [Streptococcus criceti HS-6]